MTSKPAVAIVALTGFIFYCLLTAFAKEKKNADNQLPKISITVPGANGKFIWNSTIRYNISVTDQEDGSSEFNEIPANEILLEILYFPDIVKAKKYISDKTKSPAEDAGLSLIKRSDCFNCHTAKNKLIGPSFDLVAKRYPYNTDNVNKLAKKVMQGSTGVWGDVTMPSHPTIKTEEAGQIVRWVLKNNTNPDLTYFPGAQGAFRTKEKPASGAANSVYVLIASYTDHGVKNAPGTSKTGRQTIILENSK